MDLDFNPQKPTTTTPSGSQPLPPPSSAAPVPVTPPSVPDPLPTKKRKHLKLVAIIVAIIVLVGGGAAAAYVGIMVPNKPENVLKKAVANMASQSTVSVKGSLAIRVTGEPAVSFDINVNMLHLDTAKKTMLLDVEATYAGIKIPLETRYVDGSVYFKLGDLSGLKTLLMGVNGVDGKEVDKLFDLLGSKVSNQWIEIDKSLLAYAGADCSLDKMFGVMNQDTADTSSKLLADSQYKFFTVQSTSKDTVDGQSATKFDVHIDKAKLLAYSNQLKDTSGYKALAGCNGASQQDQTDPTVQNAAEETTIDTLNVWVDGSKQVKRVKLATTTGSDTTTQMTLDLTFLDQAVTVDKPANAKPAMQLLTELGSGGTSVPSVNSLGNSLSL